MPSLTFSNIDIYFAKEELIRRFYTIKKATLTTNQVGFVNKKEFAKAALDENVKVFIIYMSFFNLKSIYPDKKARIAFLFTEKVIIPNKYSDFDNVFLE